jgi:hypothetical protein
MLGPATLSASAVTTSRADRVYVVTPNIFNETRRAAGRCSVRLSSASAVALPG